MASLFRLFHRNIGDNVTSVALSVATGVASNVINIINTLACISALARAHRVNNATRASRQHVRAPLFITNAFAIAISRRVRAYARRRSVRADSGGGMADGGQMAMAAGVVAGGVAKAG